MKVAFGLKAHSGWAAAVVVGVSAGDFNVLDRRRIDLVDEKWAKQPYHAAEELAPAAARTLVQRGIAAAHNIAIRELRAMVTCQTERKNKVAACAVLAGSPMPGWSTDEILAVHFRMHKAEGVLFREALVKAADACNVRSVAIPEKQLLNEAQKVLGKIESVLIRQLNDLGKGIGPPWGKDQKDATLAAMIALHIARNGPI